MKKVTAEKMDTFFDIWSPCTISNVKNKNLKTVLCHLLFFSPFYNLVLFHMPDVIRTIAWVDGVTCIC